MKTLQRQHKKPGQALVEFALTITLLFLMISAVIDLGLAFFAHQGLAGAAAEGASYAALRPVDGATSNDSEVRLRTRYEGGADPNLPNRARFVNLMDLDNDGSSSDTSDENAMITVQAVPNEANHRVGDVVPCENAGSPPRRSAQYCDMVVTVNYNYRPFFAFWSFFGRDTVRITATRQMTIGR